MDLTNIMVKSMRKDKCTELADYVELLARFTKATFMKEISINLGEKLTTIQTTQASGTWARK
tara:strand:+ start:423 stop:608 length:186 start_codon:yes stop_codon:yes gene_type:complete